VGRWTHPTTMTMRKQRWTEEDREAFAYRRLRASTIPKRRRWEYDSHDYDDEPDDEEDDGMA